MMKIVRLLKVAAAAFFFAWTPAVAQYAGTSPQPVTLGGTGLATIPSGSLMVGAGTSPVTPLTATSNGACLLVAGLAWTQGNCLSSGSVVGLAPIQVSVSAGVATIGLNIDTNFTFTANNLALASIASGNLLANCSASSAEPTACTASSWFDRSISSANGTFVSRIAGVWSPSTFGTGLAFSGSTINLQPAASGTIGGVNSIALVANQWVQYIDTSGLPHLAQPAVSNLSGFGTGVATALGSALNGAAGLVGYSGSLGTPTQGVLTNATGLPVLTGLSGAGTGVVAALGANVTGTGGIALANSPTLVTAVLSGLPTGSVATAATPNTLASRDANGNAAFANTLEGYSTTATAAGTTTLTVTSNWQQFFTGATTQTVVLPVASTLVLGQSYLIQNLSIGSVTVNSSGGNQVAVLAGNTSAVVTAVLTSGTSAASWSAQYSAANVAAGKALTISNNIALAGTDGTTFTFPSTSDTVVTLAAAQTLTNKSIAATQLTGSLPATNFPALTGDVTSSAGALAITLATVNSNVGSFGSSSLSPTLTVNAKGLVTAVSQALITAPASALSGNTIAPTVTFSSLTSVGALTSGSLGSGFTAVALAQGGTGQITPAAARASSGLNVDQFTGHGDSAYNILSTDRTVGTNAAFTASRTWTLPAASGVNAGQEILVADFQGTVTGANTLIISRAGSDTVNGGTAATISSANGAYLLKSDGTSRWTAQALGSAAAGGVSSITAGTGLSGGTITTSGTVAVLGGTLVNIQYFKTAGTFTYIRSANVTRAVVYIDGGGGGAGGAPLTAGGQVAIGGGGAGGGRCEKNIASVGTGLTITIGAAGTAASNTAGGNGGSSSFDTGGANYNAGGGSGGGVATAASVSNVPGGSGGSGGTNCDNNIPGAPGLTSAAVASFPFIVGGSGGNAAGGSGGGLAATGTASGGAGGLCGGGGGAGASFSGGGAVSGGPGGVGCMKIMEYTQ